MKEKQVSVTYFHIIHNTKNMYIQRENDNADVEKMLTLGKLGESYIESPHGKFSLSLRLLQNFKKHFLFIKTLSRKFGNFQSSSILSSIPAYDSMPIVVLLKTYLNP